MVEMTEDTSRTAKSFLKYAKKFKSEVIILTPQSPFHVPLQQ